MAGVGPVCPAVGLGVGRNGSVRPFKGVPGAWTPPPTAPPTVSGPGAPVLGILRASTGIVGAMFGLSTVGTGDRGGRRVPRAASQGGFPGRLPRAASQGGFPGRLPRAASQGGVSQGRVSQGRVSQGRVSRAACLVVGEPALSKNPLCIGRETTHPEENKDLAILAIRYDFSLPLPYIKGLFG